MSTLFTAWIYLDPVTLVKTIGYVGITLFVFAESGVLVGIFLPGDSLLFAAGLLAAAGYLSYWPLVACVVTAAILGDSAGYWFGKRVGPSLFKREDSRFFKQAYLIRTQQFYAAHGGRTLVLARFVPIVRTLAPILAGVGAMPYKTFLLYNAGGGIFWGMGMTSLGYFLGALVPGIDHYLVYLTLAIVFISLLPATFEVLRNKRTNVAE